MLGTHTIKTWSKTQSLIALSSGEAELYATLRAAAESLGVMSMMKDLGYHIMGQIWSDASAALGIIHRKGLGKTRHIDTGLLWIQQTAAEQRLKFAKILGKHNPADLFTKHLDQATNEGHTATLQYRFNIGRAREAPKLHGLWQSVGEFLTSASRGEWPLLSVLLGKGTTWSVDNNQWRHGRHKMRTTNVQIAERSLGMVVRGESMGYSRSGLEADGRRDMTNGPRTAAALGIQLAGTGVQRLERRPAWLALGFDPNLPAQRWRVVGTRVETLGGHAPEGATFEGRQGPSAAWNEFRTGT